jgi:hypothetical protein
MVKIIRMNQSNPNASASKNMLKKSIINNKFITFEECLETYQLLFNRIASIEYKDHLIMNSLRTSKLEYPVNVMMIMKSFKLSTALSVLKKNKIIYYKNNKLIADNKYCKIVYQQTGQNAGFIDYMITYDCLVMILQNHKNAQNFKRYFCIINKLQIVHAMYMKEYEEKKDTVISMLDINK